MLDNQTIRLEAAPEKVEWATMNESATSQRRKAEAIRPVQWRGSEIVKLRDGDLLVLPMEQVTAKIAGEKAFGLRKLAQLSAEDTEVFIVPPTVAIPFGVMERVMPLNKESNAEYWKLAEELNAKSMMESEAKTERLRALISQLPVPDEITSALARTFHRDDRLMVRSSANVEDRADFAGAGLYDSIPNISPVNIGSAIRGVWSSLWTRRAVMSRRQAGIRHEQAQMAVIVQKMIAPDYSFVLHTVNPLNRSADEVYVEIAVGLGETLASASARGTPYRLVCNKKSKKVQMLAFANFSHALRPDSTGGSSRELIDYSRIEMSLDSKLREGIGQRLGATAGRVEQSFGKAQDIEGVIKDGKIYLVQSRPQQGL
jgi:phosphoglucan,water dikinase